MNNINNKAFIEQMFSPKATYRGDYSRYIGEPIRHSTGFVKFTLLWHGWGQANTVMCLTQVLINWTAQAYSMEDPYTSLYSNVKVLSWTT